VAAERALYWLTIVDAMSEEAGARFVFFVRNKTAGVADQWLARWTVLSNGRRAVKDAFESYDRLHEAADGVADVLVLVADVPHTLPGRNYAGDFVAKYKTAGGDRVEVTLGRLRSSLADTRFSDSAIKQGVKDLTEPGLPALSPEAVEGAVASILRECAL
jgi:hypothetical protein